ncbi:hypothetical protein ANCCEY_02203 [Ancylostoma ceylanicum]|uniref:Protein kinase domain-containing protein n=1 Tax=Ancylostoma ceylanicum TaxID=53326 RepID=A0A0D6M3H4_9BILA|nr:hypothetical protein ANCCEY_02203 [Ancylostoma ceylanicum]
MPDDEEGSDALVASHVSEKDAVMQNRMLRVLFAAFLDVFCESVPSNIRDYVKNEISMMLVKLNVVPGLVFSDEFLSVRRTFAGIVSTVIKNCFVSDPNVDSRISIERCGALSSRYQNDFEEIEQIGSGGFGTVWKVSLSHFQYIWFSCFYAIKKIPLKSCNTALTAKLLNEVHLLASLQHENIVRYHTGWLEVYRDEVPTSSNTAHSTKTVVITEVHDDDAEALESSEQSATAPSASAKSVDTATATNVQLSSSDKSSSTNGPGRFWVRAKQVQASSPNFSEETVESDHTTSDLSVQPTQQSVRLFNVMDLNLQPSNIFLKHHGERIRFLLGDFGLACEHNGAASVPNPSEPGTSDAVSFVVKHTSGTGTKTYAAQEQLKSSTYGPASR